MNTELNLRATKTLKWRTRKHKTSNKVIWVDGNNEPIELNNVDYDSDGYFYFVFEDGLKFDESPVWITFLYRTLYKLRYNKYEEEKFIAKLTNKGTIEQCLKKLLDDWDVESQLIKGASENE